MSAHHRSTIDRPLVVRARPDVRPAAVPMAGQTAYVLKDPLTLELFHLTAEEFFLWEKLRAAISLKALQRAFEAHFAPRRITPDELQHGVNQLHGMGLLVSAATGQGEQLRLRADRRRRSERWQSWMKMLSFRLGSIDATRIVDRLHRRLGWLFSPIAMAATLVVFAYAAWILLAHGHEVVARLPSLTEIAQPRYWWMWLLTIVVVKVLHELAHAVTCKHVGGRCHEIGVLLLAFIPCLYCDVSDVWRLPSKWRRIAVAAAGMGVELIIAALALVVWWHAEPGFLQTWCLSVVVVCSVGTLLVNASPLLRYDGYYILSDLVEVPNLAGRAQSLLPGALRRWLLAEPATVDPLLTARQQRGLAIYAVAARGYLTLVLLSIFIVLLAWARPYRLENLVYTLGVVSVAGVLFPPLAGVWRVLRNPALRYRMRGPRIVAVGMGVLALLAAFFYWPMTRSIRGPAVCVPAEGKPVYAIAAGQLHFALPAGSTVQAGDVLARLHDADSQLALARQRGEHAVRQVRYEQLDTLRAWNTALGDRLPTARAAVADAAAQLAQLETRSEQLTVRARAAGVLIAPPAAESEHPPANDDAARLPTWAGSPLEQCNLGSWIEPGTLLGTIADPTRLEVLVAIEEADVAEVSVGQPVRVLLESSPVRVLRGEVVQVARRSAKLAAEDSAAPAGKLHLVQVRVQQPDADVLIGTRGTAKIEAERRTLSQIVGHQLRQMLRLPW